MPEKLKILLVTKLYHPWIGGVERHVQDLAESLKDRFNITILCCQEPPCRYSDFSIGKEVSKGDSPRQESHKENSFIRSFFINNLKWNQDGKNNTLTIHKAPSLGIYFSMPISPSFPLWLKRLSAEADLIHYHLPFPLAVLSHWLLTLTRSSSDTRPRILVTYHADIVRQKFLGRLLSPWTHWFLRRAHAIIATSQRLIDSSPTLSRYRDKCTVIPLAIDTEKYKLTPEIKKTAQAIRQQYGPHPIALFVGRLIPYKGLEILLQAIKRVQVPLHLIIIGNGPLKTKLLTLTHSHTHTLTQIHFLDSLSGPDLLPYFHACDFFVLPSIANNEAFGIVQLEAMACGKPVINTLLPTGVPEVSIHGKTGLTVPPSDAGSLAQAMERMARDGNLRNSLGLQAKKRVEKYFSSEKAVSNTAALYAQAASNAAVN